MDFLQSVKHIGKIIPSAIIVAQPDARRTRSCSNMDALVRASAFSPPKQRQIIAWRDRRWFVCLKSTWYLYNAVICNSDVRPYGTITNVKNRMCMYIAHSTYQFRFEHPSHSDRQFLWRIWQTVEQDAIVRRQTSRLISSMWCHELI